MASVGDSNAGNEVVVSSEEVLAVRIIDVAGDHGAAGDHNVVLCVGVQEDGVIDGSAKANRVVQLHH